MKSKKEVCLLNLGTDGGTLKLINQMELYNVLNVQNYSLIIPLSILEK